MGTININIEHTANQMTAGDMVAMLSKVAVAREHLLRKDAAGNDFLGWVDLPNNISQVELDHIQTEAARLRSKGRVIVVVGIGGSYLGARMIIEALRPAFATGEETQIVYAGHTLGEDYYAQLLSYLDHEDYSVVVISKSGTTTEPAVAFRLLKTHLEQKYGHMEAVQRIVAITDAQRGALHSIALQKGYPSFAIPDDVGGRFSVLTPVGLLPVAAAGYDIEQLIAGARDMRQICLDQNSIETNPAMLYAATRNILYQHGIKVEMLVSCQPNLRYLAEWWKQLYGESEGKDGKGLLPHSLSITTDLHSMGQYVQEGQRLMMETMLRVAQPAATVTVPTDKDNLDGLNYLAGRRLTAINECAAQGTTEAHVAGGVPVIDIEVPTLDEYTLGQLIYFFEFACGVSGYTLGVNPFDQPGVEAYKKNMFRLLGKPGC